MSKWTATQYSDKLGIDLWKFQYYVSLGFIESTGLNKRSNRLYDSSDMQTLKEKIKEYEEIKDNFISKHAILRKLEITEKCFDELVSKHFIHIYCVKENKNGEVTYLYAEREIASLEAEFKKLKNTEYYLEEKGVIKELNITKHTFDWLITNEILKSVQSKCNTRYYSILDIQKIKKAIELYKEKEMDKC